MPLEVRSISVSISVVCFFGLSIIGWFSGLASFTCCKRAVIGAFIVYLAASVVLKAVNSILMEALIEKQIKQQKENRIGS